MSLDLFIRIGWYIGITSANFTSWLFVWDYPNARSTVGTPFKYLHWFNLVINGDRDISYSGLAANHSFSLLSSSLDVFSEGVQPFECPFKAPPTGCQEILSGSLSCNQL